jgi:hypothetical protein
MAEITLTAADRAAIAEADRLAGLRAQAALDATLARKRENLARRVRLQADAETEMPRLRAVADKKREQAQAAQAAADQALDAQRTADAEVTIASIRYSQALAEVDAEQLRLDAGPAARVAVWCDELDRLHEKERRVAAQTETHKTGSWFKNLMAPETRVLSDFPSRLRRLAAIRAAQATARALILNEALTPAQLDARLEELRAGLPRLTMEPVVQAGADVAKAEGAVTVRSRLAAMGVET